MIMITGIHYFQNRRVPSLQIAFIALGLWISPAAAQDQPQIQPLDLEQKISVLVNSQRQANNLNALAFDERLSQIAREHSQDMVNRGYFSHIDPNGKVPQDRLRAARYSCPKTSGENIFQANLYSRVTIRGNQKTYDWNSLDQIAESTVKEWMASPGHRENILKRFYSRSGVGVVFANNGEVYITQVFCG
jgi:uncharacterized protein YkwD